MGLGEEKAALRRELLERRGEVSGREERDQRIFRHVTALCQWREAGRVYLYLSVKGEPDTFALARAALEAGKEVLAPVCGDGEGQMAFYPFTDFGGLRPGRWGILEPRACGEGLKAPEAGEKALCLVPGLAFDRLGNRLGYGKGYYDRFLAGRQIDTVGLCYEGFLFDRLPAESHDKKVGLVATEAGVVACGREGSKL